jgi:hypothetical protein
MESFAADVPHPLDHFAYMGDAISRPDPNGDDEDWPYSSVFFDWDSYRWLNVLHRRDDEMDWEADEEQQGEWLAGTTRLLRPLMNDLPPDVLALDMSESGKVLWTSPTVEYHAGRCTYYPSVHEYQLPASTARLATLLRSDLTVIDRLGPGTDKVSYLCPTSGQEKVVAFKAVACCSWYGGVWEEIQIMARLPPHPFILPLDSLVLEELTQLGVVGFTTPLVQAPTLDKHMTEPFKLRWLRELMGLVDELNLSFGLVHQDIAPRNLFKSGTPPSEHPPFRTPPLPNTNFHTNLYKLTLFNPTAKTPHWCNQYYSLGETNKLL